MLAKLLSNKWHLAILAKVALLLKVRLGRVEFAIILMMVSLSYKLIIQLVIIIGIKPNELD